MKLYHGTSKERGLKILNDKAIKCDNINRVYNKEGLVPTEDGFVYLTNNKVLALYYANKTAVFENDEKLMLFCVDINKEILLPDFDEIKYTIKTTKEISSHTLDESLEFTQSARVNFDINVDENFKFTELSSAKDYRNTTDQRKKVIEVVSIRNENNPYALKYIEDFFSEEVKWNKIKEIVNE
ncbi:MAG: hypothetical protein ABS911_09645 [Carnobacterium sp.]|uniref:hypothetical protein n=1 Tax=Carnobacterium sp. TaxID=48221 RepID=UPI00331637AA